MPKRNGDSKPADLTDDTTKRYGPGDFSAAIGMEAEEASAWIKSQGFTMRCVRINGQATMITQDIQAKRVNVELRDNKVTAVTSIS